MSKFLDTKNKLKEIENKLIKLNDHLKFSKYNLLIFAISAVFGILALFGYMLVWLEVRVYYRSNLYLLNLLTGFSGLFALLGVFNVVYYIYLRKKITALKKEEAFMYDQLKQEFMLSYQPKKVN